MVLWHWIVDEWYVIHIIIPKLQWFDQSFSAVADVVTGLSSTELCDGSYSLVFNLFTAHYLIYFDIFWY